MGGRQFNKTILLVIAGIFGVAQASAKTDTTVPCEASSATESASKSVAKSSVDTADSNPNLAQRQLAAAGMERLEHALVPMRKAGYGAIADHLQRAILSETSLLISGAKDPTLRALVSDFFDRLELYTFHYPLNGENGSRDLHNYTTILPGLRPSLRQIFGEIGKQMSEEGRLTGEDYAFFESFWTNLVFKAAFQGVGGALVVTNEQKFVPIVLIDGPANLSALSEFFRKNIAHKLIESLSKKLKRPIPREVIAVNELQLTQTAAAFFESFTEHLHLPASYAPSPTLEATAAARSDTEAFSIADLFTLRNLRTQVEIPKDVDMMLRKLIDLYTEELKHRNQLSYHGRRMAPAHDGELRRVSSAPYYYPEPRKFSFRTHILYEDAVAALRATVVMEYLQPNAKGQRSSRWLEANIDDIAKLKPLFVQHQPEALALKDYDPGAYLGQLLADMQLYRSDEKLEALAAEANRVEAELLKEDNKGDLLENIAAVDSAEESRIFDEVLKNVRPR